MNMIENLWTQRFEEIFRLYDEAKLLDSDELRRTALLELYDLAFERIEAKKELIKGLAHMIHTYYEKGGNSISVKLLKRDVKWWYLRMIKGKERLSKLDELLNNMY